MNKVCITCSTELKMPYQKKYCSKKCKSKDFYDRNGHKAQYSKKQERGTLRKVFFIRLLGGKCENCGYNKNTAALDFHHIKDKNFQLDTRTLSNLSFDNLKKESENCILLCANCHREFHNNLDRFLLSEYDNLSNVEILKLIKKITYEKKYCKECNKQLWYKNTTNLCKECFRNTYYNVLKIDTRKVEWPSKEILEEEIKTIPFTKLGNKYGVSDNAVRKWCKRYGINYKK